MLYCGRGCGHSTYSTTTEEEQVWSPPCRSQGYQSKSVEPEWPLVPKNSYTRSTVSQPRQKTGRKSSTGSSYGADVESQSETASVISTSTDYSETSPRLTRKAKGNITSIRTNRAFAIRRQKADGGSDTETSATLTSRSRPSSASRDKDTPRSQRSTASASARSRSSSRNRPTSAQDSNRTARSEATTASLGTKIQRRSQDNQQINRKGRGEATVYGPPSPQPRPPLAENQKPVCRALGPSARSTTSTVTSSLAVSGQRTTPTGGSQSPRSLEHTAWQRRKSYDPRKAAAESKKKSRSKSATEDGHRRSDTNRSVSSASSEDAFELGTSRTEEISSFSSIMVDQLSQMSRTTEEEVRYTHHLVSNVVCVYCHLVGD